MKKHRYLTKSLFTLALECETKVYYKTNPEYSNRKIDDPFLESLAEGGFQVGELARRYYPVGIMVEERKNLEQALKTTADLLKKKRVIIYEAAFAYKNYFIRADIIVKDGNKLELIEVKSKSFSGRDSMDLEKSNGEIDKAWKTYVLDVAFQKFVITNAYPGFEVWSYLMMADKNSRATVDGLNQKFMIQRDMQGNPFIKTYGELTPDALGEKILIRVKVDDLIEKGYQMTFRGEVEEGFVEVPFFERLDSISDALKLNIPILQIIGSKCRDCEFRSSPEERASGRRDGFRECWKSRAGFKEADFDRPSVLNIWDFRQKERMIREGKFFMKDITIDDLGGNNPRQNGMSRVERQMIQIQKSVEKDDTMLLLREELKDVMDSWSYPLHFIDFETSAVAIPFHKDRAPYEGIAFQFSHHTVDRDGNITHKGQYLNVKRGSFPNFDFIRALKQELEQDNGTIFRFAAHENTYLNIIYTQLMQSYEVADREELCNWIKTITKNSGRQVEEWKGDRNMVDLCDLVKRYYYDPYTEGSNSIKAVLPAVLNRSTYLQEKYSKPIYGSSRIPSLNFSKQRWVTLSEGKVVNPYKLLPPLFEGMEEEQLDSFITDPDLAEGGAAMMAYAKMQFSEMSDLERQKVAEGLLRYCELDTFAMVLIWEFWNNEVNS